MRWPLSAGFFNAGSRKRAAKAPTVAEQTQVTTPSLDPVVSSSWLLVVICDNVRASLPVSKM